MQPLEEVATLRRGLREALVRSPLTAVALSRELGRHETYLSRLLGDRYGLLLKVEEVFAILGHLQVEPERFFETYFPLGGDLAALIGSSSSQRGSPAMPYLDEVIREVRRRKVLLRLTPAEWRDRTGRLLRQKIRSSGRAMRDVARALDLPENALAREIRGEAHLIFEHLFAALRQISMSPGRFFTELVSAHRTLSQGLYWSKMLDRVTPLLEEAARALATEMKQAPLASPRRPTAGPKGRRS